LILHRLLRAVLITISVMLSCACGGEPQAASLLSDSFVQRIATDGPGVPIIVFNPLSWQRTDAVEVDTPFPGESVYVKITDSAGRVYPARTLGETLCFTARDVPALGYRVFWASRARAPVPTAIKCAADALENQYFRVTVDRKNAAITGIYDKVNRRQLMPTGAKAALPQLLRGSDVLQTASKGTTVMMDSGPARGMLVLDSSLDKGPFVQRLILREGVPRVDIELASEWVQSPVSGQPPAQVRACIPTVFDSFKPESGGIELAENGAAVPSLRWLDLSDGKYGVSLVADSAYDISATKGSMCATLRKQGDPLPSGRAWEVDYSIFTHSGDWAEGRVFQRSLEVANPLGARFTTRHKGDLPRTYSMFSYTHDKIIAVFLPAETPTGAPLVRFYNTRGDYSSARVNIGVPGVKLTPADQSGKPLPGVRAIIEHSFTLNLPANSSAVYLFGWQAE